jgi:putative DNA primase/helicase
MINQNAKSRTDEEVALLGYYDAEGIKMVRLDDEKRGVDKDWQIKRLPLEKIEEWVRQGGNVGWQCGAVSEWISCVDLDWPETRALASRFMPETLLGAKGQEAPSQYFYRSVGLGYAKFMGLDNSEIISLKASDNGAGHQIVVAPSVHQTKGPYRFVGGYNPAAIASVDKAELRHRVGMLAVSSLVAHHLPELGRHNLAMALAGYMLRNGVEESEVALMLVSAWESRRAPREGLRDLEATIADTARKLRQDEPVTGGRTLEELLPGMPNKIAKFLGWERPDNREIRRHYTRSDLGNAERFVDMHGDRVRWCPALKSWLFYDGRRWARDECGEARKLAHDTARSILKDAAAEEDLAKQKEIAKFAISSQNEGRINGMLSQAKPYLAVRMEELDRDRWSINCLSGTLDLRSGQIRPHDPADLITKLAPVEYDPRTGRARFGQFLRETLLDEAVISFVKRYAGYTLTGITRERLFAILYGFGKNGKTTLVELLQDAMGDYATNTDTETILAKKYQGVGNDVAALKGARFVSAAEVEQGRRLAESKVKQLTGSDTVTARFLFGEHFSFKPEFKLWLSTNNKPVIQGTDDAIWDRIRLIPFTQRFEGSKADPRLPEKLREELAGVFAWMVEGCLEWQEHGLGEPESVKAATNRYRTEMDTLASFFDERCVIHPSALVPASVLYEKYRMWCLGAGEDAETQKMFGMRLAERGFASAKLTRGPHKDRKGWRSIGLKADDPDPGADDPPPSGGRPEVKKAYKADKTADDGPLSGRSADDGPLTNTTAFAGETTVDPEESGQSGPKNQKVRLETPRVEKNVEKRSASSASSANEVSAVFAEQPDWLTTQLDKCREHERLVKPTCAAVATELFGTVTRWAEVEPVLRRHLENGGGR